MRCNDDDMAFLLVGMGWERFFDALVVLLEVSWVVLAC